MLLSLFLIDLSGPKDWIHPLRCCSMSRSQNEEFQQWWNKQRNRDHDGGDDEAFLTVEIRTPAVDPTDKDRIRTRTLRQLSRLYLLRLKQLASSSVWIASSFLHLLRTANRRIANDNPPSSTSSARLYRLIKAFLVLVVLLLCFELAAYFKGWHFTPPSVASAEAAVEVAYAWWLEIRASYLAPPLQSLTNVCIVLFLIQSVDRLVLVLGCFWIKLRRIKPVAAMEYPAKPVGEGIRLEDYPMVLVQIPMCNEKEVSV